MKTMAQKSQTQLWNHLDKAQMMAKNSVDWDKNKIEEINKLFNNVVKELEKMLEETL
jgi:hypothetical protein